MATTIPPSALLPARYRYTITTDIYKRTDIGTHLSNVRFRLWQRDPNRDHDEPVDDRHTLIYDEYVDSPVTFTVTSTTDYFIRYTKSGYKRSERNLCWKIKTGKFKWLPLLYGEGHGIVNGPNAIYSEEIAPGGIFPEDKLDRWGRFDILMDVGGSGWTGEGTLILDKGYGIKTLACSGNYTFNETSGDWEYQGSDYTYTKAADMAKYLFHHYTEDMPLVWFGTYEEWEPSGTGERFLTFYPTRAGNPGTPESNENNFPLWITDELGQREAEAFQYYIDPNDPYFSNPANPDRFRIDYK